MSSPLGAPLLFGAHGPNSFTNTIKGGSGFSLWKKDFELGVEGKGQGTSRNFEVVLGPYVQYCPCEALEQKLGQKSKSEINEIELSYCHQSICL